MSSQGAEECGLWSQFSYRKPWVKRDSSEAGGSLDVDFQRAGFSPFIFPLQEFKATWWNLLCRTGTPCRKGEMSKYALTLF